MRRWRRDEWGGGSQGHSGTGCRSSAGSDCDRGLREAWSACGWREGGDSPEREELCRRACTLASVQPATVKGHMGKAGPMLSPRAQASKVLPKCAAQACSFNAGPQGVKPEGNFAAG